MPLWTLPSRRPVTKPISRTDTEQGAARPPCSFRAVQGGGQPAAVELLPRHAEHGVVLQQDAVVTQVAPDVAGHTGLSKKGVQKDFLSQPGYATPKIDVRGAVVRENKILLVQERTDQCWAMPGGWADVGDLPSEMVAREVFEESGMRVVAKKVIGVYDANRTGRPMEFYHAFKIIFFCEITGGELRSSNETLAAKFFDFEKLPLLSLNRTNERHLAEVLAHVRDPNRAAAFD